FLIHDELYAVEVIDFVVVLGFVEAEQIAHARAAAALHPNAQAIVGRSEAWDQVKQAKENVLTMVNRAFHGLANPSQLRGTELAKRILEGLMTDAADPTAHALDVVKREAARLF
nr:hypothetical protein [Tanacetum cinerariifolium]